ncbi:MAG: 2-isopropylmalate synthase, partial [Clostridiales bacterium]|nr:2-isopropylmalate synthase [Clostridiales bacterium]
IESGATTINIPDTVGYATPIEMFDLVSYVKEHLVNPDVVISVHCHDDLGLSTANSLAAVRAGASQVECTINAIGERAGNTSLEEIVMGIKTRADYYNAYTNVDSTQIYRASRLVSTITGVAVPPNKAIVGDNAFAHEAGIHQHGVLENPETYEIMSPKTIGVPQNKMVLGKHSGKHAFEDRLKDLGYTLSNEDLLEAFNRFKRLADKKKVVSDRDIEAIVSTTKFQINDKVEFVKYQVNAETGKGPTATVEVRIGDKVVSGSGTGDGPVEACYTVINDIVGINFALDEYHVHSVSGGEDALGEAIVKISKDDDIIRGRGLSTDVVEASILAYINAINKVW